LQNSVVTGTVFLWGESSYFDNIENGFGCNNDEGSNECVVMVIFNGDVAPSYRYARRCLSEYFNLTSFISEGWYGIGHSWGL
jgi:hypothetical protein